MPALRLTVNVAFIPVCVTFVPLTPSKILSLPASANPNSPERYTVLVEIELIKIALPSAFSIAIPAWTPVRSSNTSVVSVTSEGFLREVVTVAAPTTPLTAVPAGIKGEPETGDPAVGETPSNAI